MVTETIEVSQAKKSITELIAQVSKGTEIVFTDENMPVARLVPVAPSTGPRIAGLHCNAIWVSDDFDEPLPDGFWVEEA